MSYLEGVKVVEATLWILSPEVFYYKLIALETSFDKTQQVHESSLPSHDIV